MNSRRMVLVELDADQILWLELIIEIFGLTGFSSSMYPNKYNVTVIDQLILGDDYFSPVIPPSFKARNFVSNSSYK